MKRIIIALVLIFVLVMPASMTSAQALPSVVHTTLPVDANIKDAVDAWLAVSAPIPLPYWSITYSEVIETGTFISLIALNVDDPTLMWHVTDDGVVAWMGSVIVYVDNSVEMYSNGEQSSGGGIKQAALSLAPGGGANIRFPWESGAMMMYGTRAVHAAGGGGAYATGFSAVDFVGGDDLGSGVASNRVYAAANGTVDYYCKDSKSVLVRITDTGTDTSYIYAHLLDNSNLQEGTSYQQGNLLGSLKYGAFDDNCGWAAQTSKHYHLHFGFKPANGSFRMENCLLSTSSEKWTCGTETVATGQFLKSGAGNSISITGDDAGMSSDQPNFWDYIVSGAVSMYSQGIIGNMPSHTTNQFIYALYNGISIALRVARVMVYSNLNLQHFFAVVLFGLSIRALLGIAEFFVFLFKAFKSLMPIIGA